VKASSDVGYNSYVAELWTNWAGQQRCAPARIERPATEAELVDAVGRAAEAGLELRAVGNGHSFTDAACTDGCMIDLRRMGRVLEADPATGLIRVQAGIAIHDLAEQLAARGLALENQGDIDVQSIAGAISTATHGTGVRFANLGARVEAARIVTAAGEVVEVSDEADADGLRAARASVGALGVICELTVRAVPAFTIHRVDEPRHLPEVLERLDELVDGNDHFELFAFPHADRCLTLTSERTDRPPVEKPAWKVYLEEELITNRLLGVLMRVGRAFPSATPRVARTIAGVLSRSEHTDASHRVYAHERKVRFTEMEYAIPRAHGREALRRVMDLIARRGIAVAFPIEMRFAASDDAFLSTAYGRETCYIAVHQYVGMEYETYFRAVEAIMDDYGGRPHWGKRHYQTAATLSLRYPEWERFQAVRARLDPGAAFQNDYTRRVLGPIGAPVIA
jgi:FAD-linked oxidoreductase